MRKLFLAILLGMSSVAVAAPIVNDSFTSAPLGGSAESSTAASYTFAGTFISNSYVVTNISVARGWYANCPTGTTEVVTFTGINGGTNVTTLYDGHYGPVAERIVSFTGNTSGCTIGLEF